MFGLLAGWRGVFRGRLLLWKRLFPVLVYCCGSYMVLGRGGVFIPFHSKLSCNRQNSRKAGSSTKVASFLSGDAGCDVGVALECRLLGDSALFLGRQICASKPSIWRRPLRMRVGEEEVMLSNDRESKVSMA